MLPLGVCLRALLSWWGRVLRVADLFLTLRRRLVFVVILPVAHRRPHPLVSPPHKSCAAALKRAIDVPGSDFGACSELLGNREKAPAIPEHHRGGGDGNRTGQHE